MRAERIDVMRCPRTEYDHEDGPVIRLRGRVAGLVNYWTTVRILALAEELVELIRETPGGRPSNADKGVEDVDERLLCLRRRLKDIAMIA